MLIYSLKHWINLFRKQSLFFKVVMNFDQLKTVFYNKMVKSKFVCVYINIGLDLLQIISILISTTFIDTYTV